MKKFILKHSTLLSLFAMMVTTHAANTSCINICHQPELPKTAKKLRKF